VVSAPLDADWALCCLPLGRNNDRLEILGLMTPSESRPRFALYDTVIRT
jgi:hypothetical protein